MTDTLPPRARIRPGPPRPDERSIEEIGDRRPTLGVAEGEPGLVAGEQEVLAGAFRLAERNRTKIVRIDVPDPDWEPPAPVEGEPPPEPPILLSFHIHPLTEKQSDACYDRTTDVEPNEMGVPIPVKQHSSEFNSELIITATTDEDQVRVWRNPALMAAAGVVSSTDLVDALLPMGYKGLVVDRINRISGFGTRQRRQREAILGN